MAKGLRLRRDRRDDRGGADYAAIVETIAGVA
jgi:hypothetical protein